MERSESTKSLLEILNRERELVNSIARHEHHIDLAENNIKAIQNIDIDCESKQNDLSSWEEFVESERAFIVLDKLELDTLRDELRDYIKALFKEET